MNAYTSDASVFEIVPQTVFTPESESALRENVKHCLQQHLPMTLRAGGTSLGGQAIGAGAIIDISKHLTQVVDYRPELKEIDVQPGVIQDDLNDLVAGDSLRFAPDTSTSNRAMIGGMIGNNSCGSYSVYYGTTREHVKSVEVILADGSEVTFGPLSAEQLEAKLQQQDFEGNIYRTVFHLLERHGKQILEHAPHPSVRRRNTGYALDELLNHHQPFNPHGQPFSLAPLICGSEGTLAVIKQACLNLVELPKNRQLMCAHFDSVEAAMRVVPRLLEMQPAAIELIDRPTLDGTKSNLTQQANRFWIEAEPEAVLVIELFDESAAELQTRMLSQQAWLLENGAYAAPMIAREDASKVWQVRKAGLGMLMGKVTRKKAVAVIEDAAVPVRSLYDYFKDVQALMAELQVGCVYYGHASVGLIHIRPELDLATEQGKILFRTIAGRNAQLVKKYRGALSGEHGDGRIRAPYLKEQVGEQVYAYWLELKRAFDPHNLLNPGVVLSDSSITDNLRAARQPVDLLDTGFDWKNSLSLMDAVEKCNGAAACRKSAGRGVMCPSYQVTREEIYSTRGRSNLLRRALTEADPRHALSNHELQQALDTCLGCKACQSECPASVDMSRLKSEVLYQLQQAQSWRGWSPSRLAIRHYGSLLKLGAKWPKPYNWLQSQAWIKRLMGVDVRRSLPLAQKQVVNWKEAESAEPKNRLPTVWVLCDLFSQFQEPQVGQAMLDVLDRLPVNVRPVMMQASPRALLSQGLLDEAKQALLAVVENLSEWRPGDSVVGIEPSELLVWRDEAPSLLKSIPAWCEQVLTLEEWWQQACQLDNSPLALHLQALQKQKPAEKTVVWLHVHCHQKALSNAQVTQQVLECFDSVEVKRIESGCCGMSGDFGYKHFDLSEKLAQQALLPAIEQAQPNDWIVATGTSCRHQIKDLSSKEAVHLAELLNVLTAES